MRVLVAEDDPGLREVIVLGLADAGYHVDAVDRGDDAIDQLKLYDYDVAIIDWRMPGAEGIDVVAWARRNDRPTALLMLTARDAPADRIRGPRHRRRRLPRQALRLRRAARPRPGAPAAPARRRRAGPRARPAAPRPGDAQVVDGRRPRASASRRPNTGSSSC